MINDYEATQPMTTDAVPTAQRTTLDNDDVISALNGLIETCKDGEEGFREAAEGTKSSQLKEIFYEYSQQRSQFMGALQSLVRDLGGDPEDSGRFSGAIHRGWVNIKSAIAGNDVKAVLNECERGEDSAKKTYKDALEQGLPSN